MTTPDASAPGFARRSSSASATSRIFSRRSSRFSFCFAETAENCVVPPQSSGWRPSAASSLFTRSTFASGMSILLTATTIGTSAARACEIDSFVCGMTPSSAATTRTAMSVTFAPRARIAVNASWPGVSRNVILPAVDLGLVRADVLRDPAGLGLDDGRLANRVEQRRLAVVDVAHDRHDRRARLRDPPPRRRTPSGSSSSSAACLIVISRSSSVADDLDLLVGERLRRGAHLAEPHEDLDELGHRNAERMREVLDGDAGLDRHRPGRRRCGRLPGLRRSARCGRAPAGRRARGRRRPR